MSQPFIGQIMAVGFNFAPVGWAICNGQLLSISENTALYTLLGTTYGGDGVNTFALPNLQGQVALGMGQGSGLTARFIGEAGGSENVTITANQNGSHGHTVMASATGATVSTPASGTALASASVSQSNVYVYGTAPSTSLAPQSISTAMGGLPHENRQPYLAINYIISLYGAFPSQG